MNLSKFNPWNWFKHEDSIKNEQSVIPVKREDYRSPAEVSNPIAQFHREADRLFQDAFSRFGLPTWSGFDSMFPARWDSELLSANSPVSAFHPRLDVASNDDAYTITLEAPGLSESDISIEQVDRRLLIKGNKRQEVEDQDKYYYRIERHYGEFQRVLDLPEDVQPDDIRAHMHNGLLTIQLPRRKQSEQPVRKIEIANSQLKDSQPRVAA